MGALAARRSSQQTPRPDLVQSAWVTSSAHAAPADCRRRTPGRGPGWGVRKGPAAAAGRIDGREPVGRRLLPLAVQAVRLRVSWARSASCSSRSWARTSTSRRRCRRCPISRPITRPPRRRRVIRAWDGTPLAELAGRAPRDLPFERFPTVAGRRLPGRRGSAASTSTVASICGASPARSGPTWRAGEVAQGARRSHAAGRRSRSSAPSARSSARSARRILGAPHSRPSIRSATSSRST